MGPALRGSSCAVILLIKKTTRESCARMPPTPASRAAPAIPSSGVGGLPFAVDPKLSADQATVFWRANALPTVVPLAPSPVSFTLGLVQGSGIDEGLDCHCAATMRR